eukprot:TRINITY_DN9240_c0_g1_i2.p1 TRINITY_DN9240_c0_g1~~TRINITY_DN9240_c0_g1_i2.p1  ORF type:complete len:106 (+),score=9.47 TRINITY_DN9240_c0_g1_i2:92-409(+)
MADVIIQHKVSSVAMSLLERHRDYMKNVEECMYALRQSATVMEAGNHEAEVDQLRAATLDSTGLFATMKGHEDALQRIPQTYRCNLRVRLSLSRLLRGQSKDPYT